LFREGHLEQALADADRASRSDPTDVAALQLLGAIQAARGLKEQAAETVGRRRDVERRTGRMEELILEIQERPDEPGPRCRLGQLAREAGLESLAVQSYQAALALDPDCAQARKGLLELGVPRAQISPPPAPRLVGAPTGDLPRHEP
jgi:tetratricopeptide (TPR) repeat protein